MKKGTLIVIEGTDGSGKETQAKLLCQSLERLCLPVNFLSFPCYGTPACAPVEMYLGGKFGKKPEDVSPYAASVMYAIDRYASFKTRWAAAYEKGEIFVADRYTTSNAVHQAAKLPPEDRAAYLEWLYYIEYNIIAEFLRRSRENALGIVQSSGWKVVAAGNKNGPYTKETVHAKILKLSKPLLGF